MNAPEGGFLGAVRLVGLALGIGFAFVLLPHAFAASWPWLSIHVVSRYGPGVQSWAPLFWRCVLAVLIYSLVRAALFLGVALFGLLLALGLVSGGRRE